jgi:hypothetical protein
VVDAAWRLVRHDHHGHPDGGHPRGKERRGDAVKYHHVGPLRGQRPEQAWTGQNGEREGLRGKRREDQPRVVPGSQLGQPAVIEVTPGQGVRITQG